MKKQIQTRLAAIQNEMATIENAEKVTDDQKQSYKLLVEEGKKLRGELDTVLEGEALKHWANSPDGKSAFKQMGGPEVTSPEDRDQEQRAQENAAKNAYKSAFEVYLRRGQGGMETGDRKILTGGFVKEAAQKALGETTATSGGFLVPEQFEAEVLKKDPGPLGLSDIVRAQPTSRDVIVWPTIVYTTDNKKTAPHALTFTGEVPASASTARVTDQTFGEVRIPINLAMASQLLSNSLIEDGAVDVVSLTAELFRENILQDVENYIANGTGAGQPEGLFVNATAQTNYVAGGGAATITSDGLVNLYWGVPAQYRKNGKWVMSSSSAQAVAKLKDANGRYVWQAGDMFGGGLGSAQQDGVAKNPILLGAPVAITEWAPTITTDSFPISFGDHKGYIRGDRVGMTVRVLDELYAETDQKLFLLRMRFGGQLAQDYRIKLLKVAAS